ncbi:hypothetical protein chiPu_0022413, partial [Chiloscyllium punctatum]|nr:hypothetical protein [Chiloscyllium punctatum]
MSLKYSLGEELFQNSIRFKLQPQDSVRCTVHRLAAKRMIAAFESGPGRDSPAAKQRVVEISSQANVVSSQTAFVATNKELGQPLRGPMVRRNVPLPWGLPVRGCAPRVMLRSCAGPMM